MTPIPFIEKNRNWLQTYSRTAWVVGALMICAGGLVMAVTMAAHSDSDLGRASFTFNGLADGVPYICKGLLVLLLAHFVSYVVSNRQNPGPVLRNAHLFLYGLAGLPVVRLFVVEAFVFDRSPAAFFLSPGPYLLCVLWRVLPASCWFIVFVGVGYALRRLLPVIEESKSLV